MLFYTERIYTVSGGELVPRQGLLEIDDTVHFPEDTIGPGEEPVPFSGPLLVESGLRESDFLLFLGKTCGTRQLSLEEPTPYLITRADEPGGDFADGRGVLVGLDLVRKKPDWWIEDCVLDVASRVELAQLSSPELNLPKRILRHIKKRHVLI